MKTKTYLMPFDRIIRILESNIVKSEYISERKEHLSKYSQFCIRQPFAPSDELLEKFDGTWWEVEFGTQEQTLSRCFYLADSLQDALRLRPGIDTSFWCGTTEREAAFLAEISNWLEDELF